ncbi:hypothetical protein ACWEIJ_30100 [Lentzea sp. NPDC004789]
MSTVMSVESQVGVELGEGGRITGSETALQTRSNSRCRVLRHSSNSTVLPPRTTRFPIALEFTTPSATAASMVSDRWAEQYTSAASDIV